MEERERTELLFSTEPRTSPTFATDSKYVLSTKVPVKLTSMNFEALTARQQQMQEAGGQVAAMMAMGQHPAENNWHHYQQAQQAADNDFFLPKHKGSGRGHLGDVLAERGGRSRGR
eukprot:COSAG05_NODE_539_length_8851_cov_3.718693_3_plen_116_part_00